MIPDEEREQVLDTLISSKLDRLGFTMRKTRPPGPNAKNRISVTEFTKPGLLIKIVDVRANRRLWWGYFEHGRKIREGDELDSLNVEISYRFEKEKAKPTK